MVVAPLPKGTVRAIAAIDGPLAYLSVHRRRAAGLQVGRLVTSEASWELGQGDHLQVPLPGIGWRAWRTLPSS
jgi:hypothetical protein